MKSVLILSTYPFVEARHGGQVRLANLVSAYRAAGWDVSSVAVYEPEGYGCGPVGAHDTEFGATSKYRYYKGEKMPLINDFLSGAFASAKDGALNKILATLPSALDVIHVEQPWLWPLAKKIKALDAYRNVLMVYGSQNIEAPLKQEILKSCGVDNYEGIVAEIEALEREVVCEADLVAAVTEADRDILERWGASRAVLASNGIAPWHTDDTTVQKWKARLPKQPWILYVASAHPPNFTGFNDCMGGALGCIPPGSKLVVAGSVCDHLASELAKGKWNFLNLSKVQLLHVLSDSDLAAVKSLAHAFLLPIPHGGGSNIKTAEALYSGKYVVGTEAAFRGFGDYLGLPGVEVARTPSEFHEFIRLKLNAPANAVNEDDMYFRQGLTWAKTLQSIPAELDAIMLERL
ncbi:glycosyltransferase family protein [Pseudomonas asiatica]|uniref:Glycosyltransferase n=1 Tax=Pseudomonas asiatica TaxID=2219225 RepID=A0ABU5L081_9PSED|nr:glycosyltransferase [Pseudomonas asiatica]MDZ5739564.1 glycosyltransferase [Pseudomonas asiatica]MDZ5746386.1 glycosyltransferase [Pseudomonas asiatica]MDZ5751218.1 glycosyltransferase [Pseudomonas asiatica]MDZ5754065.1 glycosyltransferase [Pseudomonas asiatica]